MKSMNIANTSATVIVISALLLPAAASLAGCWAFDEGGGTITNANPGTNFSN
jgi:hypothetical protein